MVSNTETLKTPTTNTFSKNKSHRHQQHIQWLPQIREKFHAKNHVNCHATNAATADATITTNKQLASLLLVVAVVVSTNKYQPDCSFS